MVGTSLPRAGRLPGALIYRGQEANMAGLEEVLAGRK